MKRSVIREVQLGEKPAAARHLLGDETIERRIRRERRRLFLERDRLPHSSGHEVPRGSPRFPAVW